MVLSTDLSQRATVSGFHQSLGEMQCTVGSVAVAYDDAISHTTYILVFNQALIFDDLEHNLISPMQVRMKDMIINDIPLSTLVQSTNINDIDPKAHSIYIPQNELQIPLKLKGATSYFVTRRPTEQELNQPEQCPVIIMTYDSPAWDPTDDHLDKDEENLCNQLVTHMVPQYQQRQLNAIDTTNMYQRMISYVHVCVNATESTRRKGTVDAIELARRWQIGLEVAKHTVERTTQKGVRDYTHMKGTRHLRHFTQQLAYRPLNARCYTDTMIAAVPSLFNKYTCAQIYVTEFGWTKVYPMRAKSEAPSTLDLLHNNYGSFKEMVPDNAKELTSHDFRTALRKAGAVIRPIETYTPNQNKAEAAIRELKRMYRRAMLKSGAPEVLWDHCFQLMGEI
jgi:hypothetical protein